MWGWEIKIRTQILHRWYRSRDIAHAHWRFALVRHYGDEYLENSWRYTLGHNGAPIMAAGESIGHMTDDVVYPKRSRSWPRYRKMQISRKRWEIEAQYQLTTNRKWHIECTRNRWRHVTYIGHGWSWPNYVWGLISRKRLSILKFMGYPLIERDQGTWKIWKFIHLYLCLQPFRL